MGKKSGSKIAGARGLHAGRYPPQPVSAVGPSTTLSPSFLLAQTIFEANIFGINTPTFSNLIILLSYSPMKMEETECSETSEYKIQTPENYPEESIQHKYICFQSNTKTFY